MSSISGGTAGSVPINPALYLKGNTGGDVGPDALGVIQVVGSGNINVAGNAGTNTETITLVGTTNHAVQVGNAAGSLTSIPVGLTGQVLTGVTGADPVFAAPAASAITITGDAGGALGPSNAFTFTGGATGLTFTGAGTTETLGGVLVIANGGTNANAMANTFGVNYFDGTRIVTTAVGTATHVLTSNGAGVAPTFQAIPAGGITSITGNTGGAQAGPAITLAGGTTGLSFGGAANTITTTFAGITANGGTVSLATDATASAIDIGTGAGVKTSTFGSTNTTSATTVQSGSGALNVTSTNGALTINSGTGALNVSSDAAATTVNLATGAAVKTVTLGSTNGASTTTVRSGSGALNVTSTNGALTINSGTGALAISNDASATTLTIGTGGAVKTVTLGSTNGASVTTVASGTGGANFGTSANAHATTLGSTTGTSATTVQSGTGALNITSTNGALTINSGTAALAISNNAAATTVTIATGGGVKTVTLGSTNTTSATTVQSGSGALNITATNGALTMNSGTGTLAIANDATAQTVNIATGAGAKLTQLGTTNGASSLALRYGTADFTLASATGTVMSALDTGEITMPLQPAFLAYLPSIDSNVTGNSAVYTMGSVTALTEVFDQNNDFNTNGTFTAPVTGKYQINSGSLVIGCTIASGYNQTFVTSNRSYLFQIQRAAGSQNFGLSGGALVDMDAGDTMTVTVNVTGEAANTADIYGDTFPVTFISGSLIC